MTASLLPPAVALLSGGLDSAVASAWVIAEGVPVHTLAFDYGQRHRVELEAAEAVANAIGARSHRVVKVDLGSLGGSSLTTGDEIPKDRADHQIGSGVPSTYVPARNTVFLSLGLALAEVLGADSIVIGANALDYSGYPDCRGPYLEAFERLAALATAAGTEDGVHYRVRAPLLELTKAEIVSKGVALGVPLGLTHSCYDPDSLGLACGRCDSCQLRRRGFAEAGVDDPTRYGASRS